MLLSVSVPPKFSVTSASPPPPPQPTTFRPPSISNSTTTAYKERPSNSYRLNSERNMASSSSLYEVLGIPVRASSQEIKSAYRRLARTCHPDVDRKSTSADEFMEIHAAYSTLSDPAKRALYDLKLVRNRRPLTATGLSGGYRGRNWETDQCW